MVPKMFKLCGVGILLIYFFIPNLGFAQEKEPIKIGFLASLSGGFAQTGKDMVDGVNLYFEENGRMMAGRKVEFLIEDTEAIPATSLTKARKLVEMNKVDILYGENFAAATYALVPYVESTKTPTLFPVLATDDLSQRKRSPWVARCGWTHSGPMHALADYAYNVLGYRKMAMISLDYIFGWESAGGFQRVFEDLGGKIVQKIWCPVNTQDFSPYLGQINKNVDAIWTLQAGRLGVLFQKQYQEYGLKGKIPLIGQGTTTDETILPSMGDEALGVITGLHYSSAIDNPVNKAFVKKYRANFGKVPSYYSETCYVGMSVIKQAVTSLKGDVSNRQKVMQAIRSVSLKDAPRGPIQMDPYGTPIENMYIRKVERVGGELQNTVIYTYPNVSQFWKYKPEEYLKQPVYSRDYPPLKP